MLLEIKHIIRGLLSPIARMWKRRSTDGELAHHPRKKIGVGEVGTSEDGRKRRLAMGQFSLVKKRAVASLDASASALGVITKIFSG